MKDARREKRQVVVIPREIAYAIDGVSTAGGRPPSSSRVPGGGEGAADRQKLSDWMEGQQRRYETGCDVLADPRLIESGERWRLALRRIITQFVSPS